MFRASTWKHDQSADLGFGPGLCLGRQQSLNGQHNDNKEGSQIHLGCAGVRACSQTARLTRGALEWGEDVPGKSSVLGVASASASPEAAKGGPSWTMTGVSGRTLSSHVEGQLPGVKSKDPGLVFDYGLHRRDEGLEPLWKKGTRPEGYHERLAHG